MACAVAARGRPADRRVTDAISRRRRRRGFTDTALHCAQMVRRRLSAGGWELVTTPLWSLPLLPARRRPPIDRRRRLAIRCGTRPARGHAVQLAAVLSPGMSAVVPVSPRVRPSVRSGGAGAHCAWSSHGRWMFGVRPRLFASSDRLLPRRRSRDCPRKIRSCITGYASKAPGEPSSSRRPPTAVALNNRWHNH
jgi:hypothetical protein